MDERKHPLAKCEECPLREVGKYVPTVGPEHAEVAFVGEAPGRQEARHGVPFTGPSGKLLDVVLRHHGIDRQEVVLTNACLCRPPDNATPPKSAILACRPRLLADIQDRGVETVVALGNSAAEAVSGKSGVTKLRVGPGYESPYLPGTRIIATFHPAACLRQGDQFPYLVTDIGKVKHEPRVWDPPEYIVADTELGALQLLDAIDERLEKGEVSDNPERVIVVDIEVDIEKDSSFGHPNQYGMLCVGLGYDRGKVLVLSESVMESGKVRIRLGQLLSKYDLVAQNGKFDLAGLYPILKMGLRLYFDTMLASYVFDERPGIHGLKHMAVEYLGAPQYDEEIKRYVGPKQGYGAIPRDLLYKYNAYDVACTYDMYLMWLRRFEESEFQELRRVHDFLVEASNELMYLELNGFTVDTDALKKLDSELLASSHAIEDDIDRLVGKDYDKRGGINPRSPMQVKAYLKDRGVVVDTTNEDTLLLLDKKLESMLAQGKLDATGVEDAKEVREFVQLLLDHRSVAKRHSTYVKGIAKRMYRGRVYSSYLLHGTTTGRLSSRNPNMQNIPREKVYRGIFRTANDDNVLFQTDYSQAELRVLSYLAGDTYFRDIFNAGDRDLFDELTPILYPDSGWMKDEDPAGWKELRIRVKAYVYGLAYGRSEFSIAREFDVSVADARKGMERFFDVIPEIVAFRNETRERVLAGDDLVTPRGRHRRYALITNENIDNIMNEALAFLPQSTASDMCLQALIWTRQETKGFAWIRNIVHDALIVECHKDDLDEVVAITERNMLKAAQDIVGDYVKFAVETKSGQNWGEL